MSDTFDGKTVSNLSRKDKKMPEEPRQEVEILNPRYRGATPEMVARALLRPVEQSEKSETEQEPCTIKGKSGFQSSI